MFHFFRVILTRMPVPRFGKFLLTAGLLFISSNATHDSCRSSPCSSLNSRSRKKFLELQVIVKFNVAECSIADVTLTRSNEIYAIENTTSALIKFPKDLDADVSWDFLDRSAKSEFTSISIRGNGDILIKETNNTNKNGIPRSSYWVKLHDTNLVDKIELDVEAFGSTWRFDTQDDCIWTIDRLKLAKMSSRFDYLCGVRLKFDGLPDRVADITISTNGEVGVLRPSSVVGRPWIRRGGFVQVFSNNCESRRSISIPNDIEPFRIAIGQGLTVLTAKDGRLLYSIDDASEFSVVQIEGISTKSRIVPFIPSSHNEVWLFDMDTPSIRKYRIAP